MLTTLEARRNTTKSLMVSQERSASNANTVTRFLGIQGLSKTMKEYILERSLLNAATVRSVLIRQEIYSDMRELTQKRRLLNVNSVENAFVKHVISEFMNLKSINQRNSSTATKKEKARKCNARTLTASRRTLSVNIVTRCFAT